MVALENKNNGWSVMAGEKAKSGKKGRKQGRNAKRCEVYKNEGRRARNKLLRLKRYVARNARYVALKAMKGRTIRLDKQAVNALKRLTA